MCITSTTQNLTAAIAARDVEATLLHIADACLIHNLPSNIEREEALLAVYEEYVYAVLEGEWDKLDHITSGAYLRVVAYRRFLRRFRNMPTIVQCSQYNGEKGYRPEDSPFREPPKDYDERETGLEVIRSKLGLNELQVLDFLLEQDTLPTQGQIAHATGYHRNTISKMMRKFKRLGVFR